MIAKLHSTDRILLEQAYIQIYTNKIYDEDIYVEGFRDSIKNTKKRAHLAAGTVHYLFPPASWPIYYALGKAYCDKGEYIKAALCLLPLFPFYGPVFKTIGFTAVMFHDWIRKTPSNNTKLNQMLQSICKKIFTLFDEKKLDNILNYAKSKGGFTSEQINQIRAVLLPLLPQSNQKPQPPEWFSAKNKQKPQPPEWFSAKNKKPPQVPSNVIQGPWGQNNSQSTP